MRLPAKVGPGRRMLERESFDRYVTNAEVIFGLALPGQIIRAPPAWVGCLPHAAVRTQPCRMHPTPARISGSDALRVPLQGD